VKFLSVKLGVILIIGLAIFGNAEVRGEDWKLLNSNEKASAYYDAQSITHPSKNISRVWVRWDWTQKGVINWVEEFEKKFNNGKKYKNMSRTKQLWEINCLEKTVRLLSMTYYDNKGGVIDSVNNLLSGWNSNVPGSPVEVLYNAVCK